MTKLMGVEPVELSHAEYTEYPKWVTPHASHVENGRALGFADHHVARDGSITVLVHSKNEEEIALAEKSGAQPEQSRPGDIKDNA